MSEIVGRRLFKTAELDETLKILDESDLTTIADGKRLCKGEKKSWHVNTPELDTKERNNLLRLFALGWNDREITGELNRTRRRNGKVELREDFSFHSYKVKYSKAIDLLRKRFDKEITKVCRFTDKFIRLRTLNDIAESILENSSRINERLQLNSGETLEDGEETKRERVEDTKLLLKVFDAIHKEMGVTKYIIKEKVSKKDIPETIEDKIKAYSLRLAQPVNFQTESSFERNDQIESSFESQIESSSEEEEDER